MKNAVIKQKFIEYLNSDLYGEAGFKHSSGYTIILDKANGYIGAFYKKCKKFETYKGQDTRPVEIYTIIIEEDFRYEMKDGIEIEIEIEVVRFEFWYDCNGSDDEWVEKKEERQSNREFFEFWT